MDYYRRYIADYLSKTQLRTMLEDGAYTRMLDYYYAHEGPLPAVMELVYTIAKAKKVAEKDAVRNVLAAHFTLMEDGYHQARADKELGVAVPKIEKLREVARENGKKSKGRPRKPDPVPQENPSGLQKETESGYKTKPDPVPTRDVGQPPTASHQPETKPSDHRFPGDGDSSASPPPATAAGRDQPQNLVVLSRVLEECRRAKVEDVTDDNAVITRWIWRDGATPSQVVLALTKARQHGCKPFPEKLTIGYVDTILTRIIEQDTKAREANDAKVRRTLEETAEQRSWADKALPPDQPIPAVAAQFMKHRPIES